MVTKVTKNLVTLGVILLAPGIAQADFWTTKVSSFGAPIAFYRLNESSGTTMTAAIGTDGSYTGDATLGVTGSLIYTCTGDTGVSDTGDNLATADDWGIGSNESLTIAFFARIAENPSAAMVLVSRGTPAIGGAYTVGVSTAGALTCTVRNSTGTVVTATSATTGYADNTWRFIVCRYDRATIDVFAQAVEIASEPQTGNVANGSATEMILCTDTGASCGDVVASIDELAIWNIALTDPQITDLYNTALTCGIVTGDWIFGD